MILDADPLTLRRLLDLYPVSALKEKWAQSKRKDKLLDWATTHVPPAEIKVFLDEYFSCCKQHVYGFNHTKNINALPAFRIQDSEKINDQIDGENRRMLYLARMEYHVVFTEPLREDKITFLWPIRLDFNKDMLIVRFVKMEKDASSYFEEPSKTISRSPTESVILSHLQSTLELKNLDINKGIKHLWDADRFDGTVNKFAKTKSTRTENMKPGFGFKKDYPADYLELNKTPLGPCVFRMSDGNEYSFVRFTADPTQGTLAFSTYTEKRGDTDRFVAEIIKNN